MYNLDLMSVNKRTYMYLSLEGKHNVLKAALFPLDITKFTWINEIDQVFLTFLIDNKITFRWLIFERRKDFCQDF